jgi:hypothetical protein
MSAGLVESMLITWEVIEPLPELFFHMTLGIGTVIMCVSIFVLPTKRRKKEESNGGSDNGRKDNTEGV